MNKKARELIHFHFLIDPFYFPARNTLKSFLLGLFKKEDKSLERVDYIFCTDNYLLTLNQSYLKHDTYTDIITFDLSENKSSIIAEIYISIERVKENATLYDTSFRNELLRVIIHGALHLCGYKDKKRSDQSIMREKEKNYMNQYILHKGIK